MSLIHCNLRVLMAERGLNIQKVKDQTTLSRTTISNLYNNIGSGIQFGTLRELCELLKCQPGDLFTYVDFSQELEVLTEKPVGTMEKITNGKDDEDGYDYYSSIKTELYIRCKLRYEENMQEFNFQLEVKYGIDEKKEIDSLNVGISPQYDFKLYQLKLPTHIENFVEGYAQDKLDEFLINWGYHYYYGQEIEGTTHMSINHYMLLN
ncbi:helix-turn-helix domain-containing protein [Psychrobacillus sp. NPDC058041]|uniref:helix-turn-helix domain-containing protein n=1 Tax=Psychrobacillus sp. NPDC058041 TaxID=3346310 RepID=UPI0036D930B3